MPTTPAAIDLTPELLAAPVVTGLEALALAEVDEVATVAVVERFEDSRLLLAKFVVCFDG